MNLKSGFERSLVANMKSRGINFEYETLKVPYVLERNYNPDFILTDYGFIVEAKGLLDRESKAKMLAVKKQRPELDVRFVFMNASKKIPGSKQTHGEWASKNGYKWSEGTIPQEWLTNE